MIEPNVTYSGAGQVKSPEANNINPNLISLAMGGTRVASIAAAIEQLNDLQNQLNLATNYYNTNHQDFVFWAATYGSTTGSGGHMANALQEAMQRPIYTSGTYTANYGQLDYLASTGRGQSRASFIYDKQWLQTRKRISKYNIGQQHRADLKFALARFNSELEGWNLGFRYEDHRKMMYDEQRHAHQAEILNIGIGAGNAARMGLATAVRGLSEVREQQAGQAGALANGLSTFAGTLGQKNATGQQQRQYALATANKNSGVSSGIPDVTQQQINRASGAA